MEDAASPSATGLHRHSRAHNKAAATIADKVLLRQSQRPVLHVDGLREYTTRRMHLEAQHRTTWLPIQHTQAERYRCPLANPPRASREDSAQTLLCRGA